jgi:hypothetical protein
MKIDVNQTIDSSQALSFISAGVACFAFSLLNRLGLIDRIASHGSINEQDLKKFPNSFVLKNAIITLEKNNVLVSDKGLFYFTQLGRQLLEHRGSIGLIYDGYRYVLANQLKTIGDEVHDFSKWVDWEAVARASIPFGENTIDPMVSEMIHSMQIQGTICDLGCGAATRLINLCHTTRTKGLGIEFADETVELAKKNTKNIEQISIEKGNIMNLRSVWEDVNLIMQFFVMHDVTPNEKCRCVIDSYVKAFPNVDRFIYTDIVAPSESVPTQLPGFDYVHSLLGVQTRSYEETMRIFEASKFRIVQEEAILNLPNTFIWVLQPK